MVRAIEKQTDPNIPVPLSSAILDIFVTLLSVYTVPLVVDHTLRVRNLLETRDVELVLEVGHNYREDSSYVTLVGIFDRLVGCGLKDSGGLPLGDENCPTTTGFELSVLITGSVGLHVITQSSVLSFER